jgi:iron(III) transport system permease protein
LRRRADRLLTTVLPARSGRLQPRPQSGALFSNWTLHFWIGEGGGEMAQGQAGIFRNPVLLDALWTTIRLGLVVAFTTMLLGLALAYTIVQRRAACSPPCSASSPSCRC